IEAPAYVTDTVTPGLAVVAMGQGHTEYGRYAKEIGANPVHLLPPESDPVSGGRGFRNITVELKKTGKVVSLAATDGSRIQHDRKIALSVLQSRRSHEEEGKHGGLGMKEFPLTLPLPEGYDPRRDLYPSHDHDRYRWGMVIDLDRCIGCGACVVACYAENNIGVTGQERIIEGREMSWLRIERYHDPDDWKKIIFLPMMCQHCDNAPCEPVCPVYAPHHSKEGLNNQIYNRCIGTRFCAQNCPYKVRRFNWFEWKWAPPLHLQLNPEVTVRGKGVMEKCSFCVQRIKAAHGTAKDEARELRDGDVVPACAQTCPTDAFVFGNFMDPSSQVRKLASDPRAYQVMGYLNTKPAVIYLKKVIRGR
ncbi:MAG: 4Fe-4S dicluster domain-containing protein, partial [Thermodesulfobacteriota bacterium]